MRAKAAVASGVIAASLPPVTHRVGVAVADQPLGRADRVRAGRAGRDGAEGLAAQAVLHGHHARGGVGHQQRDRRAARSAPAPCVAQHVVLRLDRADAADARCRSRSRRGRGRRAGRPSQPASSSASSAAASASWVKRSERRTSLTERCSLGSNSVARPKPSSIPDTPGAPALVQGAGADAERRDRADAGDDDGAASSAASTPPGRRPAGRS